MARYNNLIYKGRKELVGSKMCKFWFKMTDPLRHFTIIY